VIIQPSRQKAIVVLSNAYSDAAVAAANELSLKMLSLF
jgi:hypothetical protein